MGVSGVSSVGRHRGGEEMSFRFYVGTWKPQHCHLFSHAFISVNTLRGRRSAFKANKWIMDSGAFTEISKYGQYRNSVSTYAEQCLRWKSLARDELELVVAQDYMCEAHMLKKTGMTIREHILKTVDRYVGLKEAIGGEVGIMPVIQGFSPEEYVYCVEQYGELLEQGAWVGVGSVCKRNSNQLQVYRLLYAIKKKRPDLRLHGFGLKKTCLAYAEIVSLLESSDSMAWSFAARLAGRDRNSPQEALRYEESIYASLGTLNLFCHEQLSFGFLGGEK